MAIIAYSLGLRHAFDSDHIVAIDNTVRKLIEKVKLTGVGFYFSLGHSTVVFAMIVLIALIGKTAKHGMESFSTIGGIIGTIVSSTFLIIIGLTNLLYLIKVLRSHEDKQPENLGFIYRFTQRLFTFIDSQKQLYIIGFYLDLVLIQRVKLINCSFYSNCNKSIYSTCKYICFPRFVCRRNVIDGYIR